MIPTYKKCEFIYHSKLFFKISYSVSVETFNSI